MPPQPSRPVEGSDEPFLFELFCSVRAAALAHLPAPALEPLMRMQYTGMRHTYAAQFPDAEHTILLEDGEPVGASYVSRTADEIRLVDVALLPEHRGGGHGTAVVRGLQDDARAAAVPLRLSVDVGNVGARRLYERLGFAEAGRSATHIELAWSPGTSSG